MIYLLVINMKISRKFFNFELLIYLLLRGRLKVLIRIGFSSFNFGYREL